MAAGMNTELLKIINSGAVNGTCDERNEKRQSEARGSNAGSPSVQASSRPCARRPTVPEGRADRLRFLADRRTALLHPATSRPALIGSRLQSSESAASSGNRSMRFSAQRYSIGPQAISTTLPPAN
jgi:hypothetical protein